MFVLLQSLNVQPSTYLTLIQCTIMQLQRCNGRKSLHAVLPILYKLWEVGTVYRKKERHKGKHK